MVPVAHGCHFQRLVPEPNLDLEFAGEHGGRTTRCGTSHEARPSGEGVACRNPISKTTPSIGLPRMDSPRPSGQLERTWAVGRNMFSPRDMTGTPGESACLQNPASHIRHLAKVGVAPGSVLTMCCRSRSGRPQTDPVASLVLNPTPVEKSVRPSRPNIPDFAAGFIGLDPDGNC